MAGLFPGICNSQNVDRNGVPLRAAVLTVYQGGTLTLANCFQDIGLAIPAQNPMTADADTGRLPIFYVADGVYRVRLVDETGVQIYDYLQVASIGASASGGGGSAVDPTTVFATGDLLWLDVDGARNGWVRDNGRTMGSALSGASERANADCQALFLFGWAAGWTVVGGRGVLAAADWAANKQITLPDKRGGGPIGMDTMGNAAAGLFTGVPFVSGDAATAGSVCGENLHTLVTAELASHPHSVTDTHKHFSLADVSTVGPAPTSANQPARQRSAGGGDDADYSIQGTNTPATIALTSLKTGAISVDPAGSDAPHNNVSRSILGTFYRKL